MPPRTDVPVFAENLYSRTAILDPYPQYARLRALGPVVWLSKHKVYALPRYADCKAVLLDDATFISGAGVGLNPLVNRAAQGTTLNSDGCPHADRRSLVAPRLTPRALRAMQESVEEQADRVVEEAVGRGHVDGVGDVAMALPMAVVPDLVGWPQEGRSELLKWGAAAFDALGPLNRRSIGSIPAGLELKRYARGVVARREVLPGSMADDLLRAADEGKVAIDDCPALMIDYMAPSIDTTLSAIASALHLFSRHPEQWAALQEDPSRVPNAVNEVVRLESPLRAFSRKVTATTDVGGTSVPTGSRVLVMYASANRDELEWDNPDAFDISRDAGRQLGFGHGTHGCAGQVWPGWRRRPSCARCCGASTASSLPVNRPGRSTTSSIASSTSRSGWCRGAERSATSLPCPAKHIPVMSLGSDLRPLLSWARAAGRVRRASRR